MIYVSLVILLVFEPILMTSYNPVPFGSLIVSTTRFIEAMQPIEYGTNDRSTVIFNATDEMLLVKTIFDATSRDLFVIFTNTTTNILYIRQLVSVGKLAPTTYQLPVSFNTSTINRQTSFSSDVHNKRLFLTNQTGSVTMFSMSGSMKTTLTLPKTITDPVRSVGYNEALDRLFLLTDSSIVSCTGLDTDHLQCCQTSSPTEEFRSIVFDPSTSRSFAYVTSERHVLYQVVLDRFGCPKAVRPFNTFGNYRLLHLVIDGDLSFCSASVDDSHHNSMLIITNGIQTSRVVPFSAPIVALHLSYPHRKSMSKGTEISCFHGITYYDYRVAVILAAVFGTVMGILMCFNALFCVDFFMTKRIIRELKKQIPSNLLEDRWQRLVNEKYAKLALQIHRKNNDPKPKHRLSMTASKPLPATTNHAHPQSSLNPIPKLSDYLRRKSESYLSRRRSDEYRYQRQLSESRSSPQTKQKKPIESAQAHIMEENSDEKNVVLKNEKELL